jgi:hypothetical protein
MRAQAMPKRWQTVETVANSAGTVTTTAQNGPGPGSGWVGSKKEGLSKEGLIGAVTGAVAGFCGSIAAIYAGLQYHNKRKQRKWGQ